MNYLLESSDLFAALTDDALDMIHDECWEGQVGNIKLDDTFFCCQASIHESTTQQLKNEHSVPIMKDVRMIEMEQPRKLKPEQKPTRPRKPKRAREKQQIEKLRAEITELESELQQRQTISGIDLRNSQKMSKVGVQVWRDAANVQSKAREQALERNVKLKRMVTTQLAFIRSLESVLCEWSSEALEL